MYRNTSSNPNYNANPNTIPNPHIIDLVDTATATSPAQPRKRRGIR